MAAGEYSFIDLSVLEEVRVHFAQGEPMLLLTSDLDRIVWANGPGARFLGYPDVEAAMGAGSRLDSVTRRQIMAVPAFPKIGRDRTVHLRVGGGFSSRPVSCRASQVRLPDGEGALLLVIPVDRAGKESAAASAIAGIGNGGKYAALVGGGGEILAESEGLSNLGVSHATLSRLILEVRHERDRLIKRMIPTASGTIAAGIGRLSEVPPLHLLVLVADMAERAALHEPERLEEPPQGREAEVRHPQSAQTSSPALPTGVIRKSEQHDIQRDRSVESAPASETPPLRFSWRTDPDGRLAALSEEFMSAMGESSSRGMIGRSFAEIAAAIGMEGGVEIDGLLQRRETWSGRTVLWPIAGRRIPVDLAALPAYDRDRNFDGFRGFGVAHLSRPEPEPEQSSTRDLSRATEGPAEKVIRLEEHRNGAKRILSESERSAFQEIAARLRRETGPAPEAGSRTDGKNRAEDTGTPVPPLDSMPAAIAPGGKPNGEPAPAAPDSIRLLEQLPLALVIRTQDGEHHANAEFLRLTGYASSEEFSLSGGLETLFGDPRRIEGEEHPARHMLTLRTSTGLEHPCEAVLKTLDWAGAKALMLAIRPVETTADAAQLHERIAELTAILDTATDGVVLIRPDGTIRSVNHSAEALFGQGSGHLAGKPFTSLFAVESQGQTADYLSGLTGNGVASILNDGREVIGREANGGFIPLFMTIGKLPGTGGFCAVLRDITPWKRTEEELVQARGAAERASSQKTGFLARISHEIRTPLNAIIGFSELMMDERFGAIGNERYRDYLRDINRSGNHVLELVNDLLDISKIEAGEQEMTFEAVSLNDSLADAVAMMQPEANRERVIIRSSFASGLPDVVADRRSIKQIALNLLSNAIRFTPPGGQVIVSTALEPSGNVVMRLRDTGIGMSKAEIEHALKPFKQVTRMQKMRSSGTGLGLPLTKAMVEANRAGFAITSEPEQGTIVEVEFPATRVLAQ